MGLIYASNSCMCSTQLVNMIIEARCVNYINCLGSTRGQPVCIHWSQSINYTTMDLPCSIMCLTTFPRDSYRHLASYNIN